LVWVATAAAMGAAPPSDGQGMVLLSHGRKLAAAQMADTASGSSELSPTPTRCQRLPCRPLAAVVCTAHTTARGTGRECEACHSAKVEPTEPLALPLAPRSQT